MDRVREGLREFGLYAVVVAVLLGVVCGGLFLSKQRQAHYSAAAFAADASLPKKTDVKVSQSQDQQAPLKSAEPRVAASATDPKQNTTIGPADQSISAPQPSDSSATSTNNNSVSANILASTPAIATHEVPATGASLIESALTGVLMATSTYLALYHAYKNKAQKRP